MTICVTQRDIWRGNRRIDGNPICRSIKRYFPNVKRIWVDTDSVIVFEKNNTKPTVYLALNSKATSWLSTWNSGNNMRGFRFGLTNAEVLQTVE